MEHVLDSLSRDRGACAPRSFVVVSPVAEGADRIVAEAVLARAGSDLEAVLPLEPDDYETDFETEDSKAAFRRLLARAPRAECLPPAENRNAAYEAAGRRVAARADVLVAIWNGEPAAGRGGTAEIVEHARSVGKPLVWIRSTDPGQVVWERL